MHTHNSLAVIDFIAFVVASVGSYIHKTLEYMHSMHAHTQTKYYWKLPLNRAQNIMFANYTENGIL